MNVDFWKGKIVFLTGHTGFKGGWVARWLNILQSSFHGYSLELPSQPNFFKETCLSNTIFQ